MGILDSLFGKGNSYAVAYDLEGEVIAYTTGISAGKQILDKYIESLELDENYIRREEEFYRKNDGFVSQNEDRQICIVDKTMMLKKDVKKLMETEKLIPDRTNIWMKGLDKYTRE